MQIPDEDIVANDDASEATDEMAKTIGVIYEEGEPLRAGVKEDERDAHRWELDPASSEDYVERTHPLGEQAEPLRHMRHEHRSRATIARR